MTSKETGRLRLVEEVSRKNIELLVHAAFYVGFIAAKEQRTVGSPYNFEEIKNLKSLIK